MVATCYLLGVSTRRMDRLVHTLGITSLSKSQVSEMAKSLDATVEAFHTRPLDAGPYTFVAADALVLKVREGGRTVGVHALSAVGVNADGYRDPTSRNAAVSARRRVRGAWHILLPARPHSRSILRASTQENFNAAQVAQRRYAGDILDAACGICEAIALEAGVNLPQPEAARRNKYPGRVGAPSPKAGNALHA